MRSALVILLALAACTTSPTPAGDAGERPDLCACADLAPLPDIVDARTEDASAGDVVTPAADALAVDAAAPVDAAVPVDAGDARDVRVVDACTACNGFCTNLQTSNANCGACGRQCGGGATCTNGTCTCPSGQTLCNGRCVELRTNRENCGACGRACALGSFPPDWHLRIACIGGECQTECETGYADCSHLSGCESDLRNDPFTCGACNVRCGSGRCADGGCQ